MARKWIYTVNGTAPDADGNMVLRDRITIEITMVKGQPQTRILKKEFFLPEEERIRIDKKRMEDVGRRMSDFYNSHPEYNVWDRPD